MFKKMVMLFVFFFVPLCFAKEIKVKAKPPKYYVGQIDLVEFHKGLFLVKFYSACDKFKYYDAIYLKRLRGSKRGIYFLDQDIAYIEVLPTPPELLSDVVVGEE